MLGDSTRTCFRIRGDGERTSFRKGLGHAGNAAHYAPSGHLVYAEAGSLLAVPFDLARLELTGAPVPVVEDVKMTLNGDNAHFSFSRNGTLVYVPVGEQRTILLEVRNGTQQEIGVRLTGSSSNGFYVWPWERELSAGASLFSVLRVRPLRPGKKDGFIALEATTVKGTKVADFRLAYVDSEGLQRLTRRGFCIRRRQLPELLRAVEGCIAAAEELEAQESEGVIP